jgi:hypothetical protein
MHIASKLLPLGTEMVERFYINSKLVYTNYLVLTSAEGLYYVFQAFNVNGMRLLYWSHILKTLVHKGFHEWNSAPDVLCKSEYTIMPSENPIA